MERSTKGSVIEDPFQHVLCPVDFSAHSRHALRYAARLAHGSKGNLTVLFVNDPLLGAAAAAAAYDVKALAAKTEAELRRFVARAIGKDVPVSIATAFGHPAPEIQKAAERLSADLVVMGARGLTGLGKWFFGSTTERMLRSAGVRVLVVPRSKHRLRALLDKAIRAWPGKRILVPVDLGDYALADVRAAIEVVRAFRAKAILVYVIPAVQFPPWLRVDQKRYDRERVQTARAALDKLARALAVGAASQIRIGDPAEQIARSASDAHAGLIVLTLKRSSDPFGARQGSITYRVLSSEVAPILGLPASSPQR